MIAQRKENGNGRGRAKPTAPAARIVHHSRGRTRIVIPSKRKDAVYFERLRKGLERQPGIRGVTVNPTTGTGLVLHDVAIETLRDLGRDNQLFELAADLLEKTTVGRSLAEGIDRANEKLARATAGKVDLPSLAFFGLVGAAITQVARGEVLAPASTLLSDAMRLLAASREK